MQLPIQIDRDCRTPLQVQLSTQLRTLILKGQLKSGAALPGSREMAQSLKLSRNTVLLSYDQLAIEGYLEPRAAKGTFVSGVANDAEIFARTTFDEPGADETSRAQTHALVTSPNTRPLIDFTTGKQSADNFPAQAWRRLLLQKIVQANRWANADEPQGLPELRQAIADHVCPARGLIVHREQIVIVSGISEALNVVCRLFQTSAASVAVEAHSAHEIQHIFTNYGADVVPWRVDRNLDLDNLATLQNGMLYLTPSHQMPSGDVLSTTQRNRILNWAYSTRSTVIEHDQDFDLNYESPIPSLAAMAQADNVIHIGDFSKLVGVRIGYVVVPPRLIRAASDAKGVLGNNQSWLDQSVLAEFIRSGGYSKHLRRMQKTYRSRRDVLVAALNHYFADAEISGQRSGTSIIWRLPANLPSASEIEKRARLSGIHVNRLHHQPYRAGSPPCEIPSSLILGYDSVTEPSIRTGIQRLASIVC